MVLPLLSLQFAYLLDVFYTYIIESETTMKWYYGFTKDPEQRIGNHNRGWNKSTRGRGPWKLIFLRPFEKAEEARELELYLKRIRNKGYIINIFRAYFLPLKE